RVQRVVGDKRHAGAISAQTGDGLVRAGDQLIVDVDRAVEVEDVGIESTEAGSGHSPPPSAPTRAISASTSAGSHRPRKNARSAIVKRSRMRWQWASAQRPRSGSIPRSESRTGAWARC